MYYKISKKKMGNVQAFITMYHSSSVFMMNVTPSGMRKHCESTEPESHQAAEMFFFLFSSSSAPLPTLPSPQLSLSFGEVISKAVRYNLGQGRRLRLWQKLYAQLYQPSAENISYSGPVAFHKATGRDLLYSSLLCCVVLSVMSHEIMSQGIPALQKGVWAMGVISAIDVY